MLIEMVDIPNLMPLSFHPGHEITDGTYTFIIKKIVPCSKNTRIFDYPPDLCQNCKIKLAYVSERSDRLYCSQHTFYLYK